MKEKYKCIEDNCLKRPSFNFDSENKGNYCVQHKKEGMVDLKHKRNVLNKIV